MHFFITVKLNYFIIDKNISYKMPPAIPLGDSTRGGGRLLYEKNGDALCAL